MVAMWERPEEGRGRTVAVGLHFGDSHDDGALDAGGGEQADSFLEETQIEKLLFSVEEP